MTGAAATAVRVVLADDSVLLREGLARLLEDEGIEVVGQAGDSAGLLHCIEESEPDAAVVDIRMPPTHTLEGLEAAQEIRRNHAGVGVLVLSQHLVTSYAFRLLENGAGGVGYLLKDRITRVDSFASDVRRVAAGGSAIDPEIVRRLMARPRRRDPLGTLSSREREVLALMAEGRSNAGIAGALVVNHKTVESHVRAVFDKLDLHPGADHHRRVLAVLSYLRTAGPLAE